MTTADAELAETVVADIAQQWRRVVADTAQLWTKVVADTVETAEAHHQHAPLPQSALLHPHRHLWLAEL
jgi:hypothetical protein